MAGNKKPKKKMKSVSELYRRASNVKMRNMLIEMKIICHPIDNFFKELRTSEEVLFINDMAIMKDEYFQRYLGIATAYVGFCDVMEILYKRKSLDASHIEPLRHIFQVVDTQESFTEKEVTDAENSWKEVRSVLANSTFGEVDALKREFEQKERLANGIHQ